MKKKAKYIGFSSHDCEAKYLCPYCNTGFGSWDINNNKKNANGSIRYCPHCLEELDGLGSSK